MNSSIQLPMRALTALVWSRKPEILQLREKRPAKGLVGMRVRRAKVFPFRRKFPANGQRCRVRRDALDTRETLGSGLA